jgi:hypothetical protein
MTRAIATTYSRKQRFHRAIPDNRGAGHTPERPACGVNFRSATIAPAQHFREQGLRPCPKCFADNETGE